MFSEIQKHFDTSLIFHYYMKAFCMISTFYYVVDNIKCFIITQIENIPTEDKHHLC